MANEGEGVSEEPNHAKVVEELNQELRKLSVLIDKAESAITTEF
ncbi:hypothetical protein COLO4_05249 [Corchorus olitorius]|uniref:Uncharacterized protein n=1 Tax=Corchorus olitorius TaxID=93759 RepID=A0A1R3KRH6_9ROSI|nr:hypothetical protein COLO4_05249 [Corchorus olitorius]